MCDPVHQTAAAVCVGAGETITRDTSARPTRWLPLQYGEGVYAFEQMGNGLDCRSSYNDVVRASAGTPPRLGTARR